jgi:hypothetical protein
MPGHPCPFLPDVFYALRPFDLIKQIRQCLVRGCLPILITFLNGPRSFGHCYEEWVVAVFLGGFLNTLDKIYDLYAIPPFRLFMDSMAAASIKWTKGLFGFIILDKYDFADALVLVKLLAPRPFCEWGY